LLSAEAHKKPPGALVRFFEHAFNATLGAYKRSLDVALRHRGFVLGVALLTFVATAYLFATISKGFFPEEDIGQIQVSTEASEDTSFVEMVRLQDRVATLFRDDPSVLTVSSFNGGGGAQNTGRMFINLKPRAQRRSARLFRDVPSDSQLRGLQATLRIDRDRANTLGVSIDALRSALFSAFGERQVSTIYTPVDSYQVIMEVTPNAKQDESAFNNIFVRSSTGALVPLSSFASVERTVGPTAINHVGQLQAVTISFNLAPNVALGDATA